MKPYIKIYYNFRYSSGYTQEDLTDDLLGFNIEDDGGKIKTAEILLSNPDGRYSKGGSDELEPGKWMWIRAGMELDEFGEEDKPDFGVDNYDIDGWPFYGEILEVQHNGPFEVLVLCAGVAHTANNRYVACEKFLATSTTINDLIKGAGNDYEEVLIEPYDDGIAYLYDAEFWQSGYPFTDQVNADRQLDVGGVHKGGYSAQIFDQIRIGYTKPLFSILNKLADAIGFICQYRLIKTADAFYPGVYFYPKYFYSDFYPNGDFVDYGNIEGLFTAMADGEGSQWEKKHRFKYGQDNPSGDWSGFLDHDITMSAKRKFEKVTVYGKSSLGVVGVAGLSAGFRTEVVYNEANLESVPLAQMIAQIKYEKYRELRYEGTIEVDLNWQIRRGDPIWLWDSRMGWTGSDALCLQVVGYNHIYSPGDEATTEIKVGATESFMGIEDRLMEEGFQIANIQMFLPSDSLVRCPMGNIDEFEVEDEAYCCNAPQLFSATQGAGDYEVDLAWTKANVRQEDTLEEFTFDQYKIYWAYGTTAPEKDGTGADGVITKVDDASLGNIDTEDLTWDMDAKNFDYAFRLVAVMKIDTNSFVIECADDTCESGPAP